MRHALETTPGYWCGLSFAAGELAGIRGEISRHLNARIEAMFPHAVDRFASLPLDRYHEAAELIDHKALCVRANRMLDATAVDNICSMSVLQSLRDEFGPFDIPDVENIGHANMVWRIVRPGQPADVGPLHADAWFWELGHGKAPPDTDRIKVWTAVHCEPNLNGLRVIADSHCQDWAYHGEVRDGLTKPVLDVDADAANPVMLNVAPGDAVIFHDRLVHGGVSGGSQTRVSLEFTIQVRRRASQ